MKYEIDFESIKSQIVKTYIVSEKSKIEQEFKDYVNTEDAISDYVDILEDMLNDDAEDFMTTCLYDAALNMLRLSIKHDIEHENIWKAYTKKLKIKRIPS